MQTNREDVGERYLEIEIPYPKTDETSARCASAFEEYFGAIAGAKLALREALTAQGFGFHLFFA
jgi:type I restriction enzyme M protein